MKRLAVLGGMFNPVHLGHLLLAEVALTQCGLDGVLWVPSRYAHYKSSGESLDLHHRLEMIRRAIAPNPNFQLADLAQPESGVTYALDLFQQLQERYPDTEWYWIAGLDTFQSLPKWTGRQLLIQHCTWIIAPRLDLSSVQIGELSRSTLPTTTSLPDWLEAQTEATIHTVCHEVNLQGLSIRWRSLQMPLIPISSQQIRAYCHNHQSIRYLVPDAVQEYVTTHQLYMK